MEFRFYQTYNEFGVYSEKRLQYRPSDSQSETEWEDVPLEIERVISGTPESY